MSMREASLRLHARKSSMEVLARLDHKARDDFNGELLDALWDVYEAGDPQLPIHLDSLETYRGT